MVNDTNYHHMYDQCKKHMHAYVLAETNDGSKVDGIITGLDDEYVYLAVPIGGEGFHHEAHQMYDHSYRQFGYHGGYGYGYGPGYGYPPYHHGGAGGYPRRRFNRLVLPLAALTALSILPWY